MAARSLGPIRDGPAGDATGTGTSRSGLRVADRGAGPDHSSWARDGWPARYFRRVRKGDLARTNSGWAGPRPAERQTIGSAADSRSSRRRDREGAPSRRHQSRNRPAAPGRPDLGAPHSGGEGVKRPAKDPFREERIHNEAIVDAG